MVWVCFLSLASLVVSNASREIRSCVIRKEKEHASSADDDLGCEGCTNSIVIP